MPTLSKKTLGCFLEDLSCLLYLQEAPDGHFSTRYLRPRDFKSTQYTLLARGHGHTPKGYGCLLPLWQIGTLYHGVPQARLHRCKFCHFNLRCNSVESQGYSRYFPTPFILLMLWMYVCPLRLDFITRCRIGCLGGALRNDYSQE